MVLIAVVAGCSFEPGRLAPDGAAPTELDGGTDVLTLVDGRTGDPPDEACADDDSDGVCNAVDDWPCGAKPAAPAMTIELMRNGTATQLELDDIAYAGQGQLAVVAPGASGQLALEFEISDTACTGNCRDQIEIGWEPGGRVGCVFDDIVPKTSDVQGNVARPLNAPTQPGSYELKANIGQRNSCEMTTEWWALEPASWGTIAVVCVH